MFRNRRTSMNFLSANIKRVGFVKAGIATMLLSSLAVFQSAHAVGTAAGTDITNTATVNFSVGGVAQTPVNSNTTTFEVDRKVDLSVSGTVITTTAPSTNNVGL